MAAPPNEKLFSQLPWYNSHPPVRDDRGDWTRSDYTPAYILPEKPRKVCRPGELLAFDNERQMWRPVRLL